VLGAEGAAAERAASWPRDDALQRFARENVARGVAGERSEAAGKPAWRKPLHSSAFLHP